MNKINIMKIACGLIVGSTLPFQGYALTLDTLVATNKLSVGTSTNAESVTTALGDRTTASGFAATSEGQTTRAEGGSSHAEGISTVANGIASHTEGNSTKAYNNYSHAEGSSTLATGVVSHAEGEWTTASGSRSHSQNYFTRAWANNAHAGGLYSEVLATHTNAFIHASGTATNAMRQSQYPDTAHFERLHVFSAANNNSNSILARWENDLRYATTNQGAKADSAVQPGTSPSFVDVTVSGNVTAALFVASSGYITSGGNARGPNAVDLQTTKTNAWMVASGANSVIAGGKDNTASGSYGVVGGGDENYNIGSRSFIGGGWANYVLSNNAAVVGGMNNVAANDRAFIGGGNGNLAYGLLSTIGGGDRNHANYPANWTAYATIGGGIENNAYGHVATIVGGLQNSSMEWCSFVGAGFSNTASGAYAAVPGGNQNTAAGESSFAAGQKAQANHSGSFVWADTSDSAAFATSSTNQFLIRAAGGVGIGTNSPTVALDVAGRGRFTSGILCPAQGDISMGSYTNGPQ